MQAKSRTPGERQVFSRVDCSSLRCSESKGLSSSCLADGSDPHTVLVPRSLSNPHGAPLAFSSNPWAVGDAAEWEQNQAGIRRGEAPQGGVACENPLLDRKQPTSLSAYIRR